MIEKPSQRIVVCRGQYCNLDRRADKLLQQIEPTMVELAETYDAEVRVRTANCLSMCGVGPNCVVYPQNTVFNSMRPDTLDELYEHIEDHLKLE